MSTVNRSSETPSPPTNACRTIIPKTPKNYRWILLHWQYNTKHARKTRFFSNFHKQLHPSTAFSRVSTMTQKKKRKKIKQKTPNHET